MKIDMERTPWMQKQIVEFMNAVADDAVERDTWDDEHPEVWLVAKQDTALGFPDIAVAQMPIPDFLWDQARPPVVLATLAQSCKMVGAHPLTPEARADLYGIVMLSETWDMVIPASATREEREEAHEFASRRGIPDHPWGVEAKTVFSHDIAGWDMVISRRRGGEPGTERASEPGTAQATGNVVNAMTDLLNALR